MSKNTGSEDRIRSHEMVPRGARIKVLSVGAGGNQALNKMIAANVRGVDFISVNTNVQALKASKAPARLQLGALLTHGHGTRGNSELGRRAALEDSGQIIDTLDGAEVVFVVASLGGGTGTGAAPVVASLAKQMGALTVAVVTLPFGFEGRRRMKHADRGVDELLDNTDTLIVIPNERLLAVGEDRFFFDSFHLADDMLCHAVQGVSDILAIPGGVNRELAELRTAIAGMGHAMIGTATRSGSTRAVDAAVAAMASPLLDSGAVHAARSILINFTGSSSLKLSEVNEASNTIRGIAHKDADIVFSAVLDESIADEVKVTLIVSELRLDRNGHAERGARNNEEKEMAAPRPIRLEKFIGRRSGPTPTPSASPAKRQVKVAEPISPVSAAPVASSAPVQQQPSVASDDTALNSAEAFDSAPPVTTASTTALAETVVAAPAEQVSTDPVEPPVEPVVAAPAEQVAAALAEPEIEPPTEIELPREIEPPAPVAASVNTSVKTEEPLPVIAAEPESVPEPVQEELPAVQSEAPPTAVTEAPQSPHIATVRHAAFAAYAAVSMPEDTVEVEDSPAPLPAGFAAILESRLWKADDTDDDFETLGFEPDTAHAEIPEEEHFNQFVEPEVEDTFALDLAEEHSPTRDTDIPVSEPFQTNDFELPRTNEFFGSPVFRTTIPFKSRASGGLGKSRVEASQKAAIAEPQMFDFSIGTTQLEDDERPWEAASKNTRPHPNFPSFASGQAPAGSEDEFDELDIPAFLRRGN